ncbi:MAG: hypothetical protein ACXWIP_04760 [Burkholderiales bacterium]
MAQHGGLHGGGGTKRKSTGKRSASSKQRKTRGHGADSSESTMRAKWINSADDREDYPGQTLATRNHEVIRRWSEERKAKPATAGSTDPEHPRVLRLDFPPYGEGLQDIDWDVWFRTFDERNLIFMFQEHLRNGRQSNFFRLVNPENEDA